MVWDRAPDPVRTSASGRELLLTLGASPHRPEAPPSLTFLVSNQGIALAEKMLRAISGAMGQS